MLSQQSAQARPVVLVLLMKDDRYDAQLGARVRFQDAAGHDIGRLRTQRGCRSTIERDEDQPSLCSGRWGPRMLYFANPSGMGVKRRMNSSVSIWLKVTIPFCSRYETLRAVLLSEAFSRRSNSATA